MFPTLERILHMCYRRGVTSTVLVLRKENAQRIEMEDLYFKKKEQQFQFTLLHYIINQLTSRISLIP